MHLAAIWQATAVSAMVDFCAGNGQETRAVESVVKETVEDPEMEKQLKLSKDVSAGEKNETKSEYSRTPVEAKDSMSIVGDSAHAKE
jgi:hypothetical protein